MKKIKKLILSLFLLVVSSPITLLLTSCSSINNNKETVTIVDMAGDVVTVPKNPKRISCSSRNAYDLLISYGLGENIVSMHNTLNTNDWIKEIYKKSKEYESVDHSEQVESYYKQNVDLVLAGDKTIARNLREKGINAITICFYGEESYDNLLLKYSNLITEIWDSDEAIKKSNQWEKDLTNIIEEIKAKVKNQPKRKLYYVRGDSYKSLNSSLTSPYFIEFAYRILGFEFYGSNHSGGNVKPSDEAIISFNPDVITFGGIYQNKNIYDAKNKPQYKNINAVKNNNLYSIPVGFSPFEQVGFILPVFFADQANKLYPNLFKYDIENSIRESLKYYLNYDITNEKIDYMCKSLNPDGEEF